MARLAARISALLLFLARMAVANRGDDPKKTPTEALEELAKEAGTDICKKYYDLQGQQAGRAIANTSNINKTDQLRALAAAYQIQDGAHTALEARTHEASVKALEAGDKVLDEARDKALKIYYEAYDCFKNIHILFISVYEAYHNRVYEADVIKDNVSNESNRQDNVSNASNRQDVKAHNPWLDASNQPLGSNEKPRPNIDEKLAAEAQSIKGSDEKSKLNRSIERLEELGNDAERDVCKGFTEEMAKTAAKHETPRFPDSDEQRRILHATQQIRDRAQEALEAHTSEATDKALKAGGKVVDEARDKAMKSYHEAYACYLAIVTYHRGCYEGFQDRPYEADVTDNGTKQTTKED